MSSWIRVIGNRGRAPLPDPATEDSGAAPAAVDALPRAIASIPATVRIWTYTSALAILAGLLYLVILWDRPSPSTLGVPWPLLALAFAAAEMKVIEVHFRRETHSFSLSEFPAVIGFFFLSPTDYLIAILVGSGAALFIGARQRLIKTAFNLANFLFVAVIALSIVTLFSGPRGEPGLQSWTAAFAATLASTVLSAVTIATVITLSGGAPQFEKLPEMIRFGSMVAFANTSLALLAVAIIQIRPSLLWLLALPLVIVFLAYRAYLSEREKHERLELLYQSSRILQHSPELDSTLVALLDHARAMFRAELAEIVLYPRGGAGDALRTASWHDGKPEVMVPVADLAADPLYQQIAAGSGPFFFEPGNNSRIRHAMVSPLRGESALIGSLSVANRLTEGTTFRDDDLPLMETLANQVAVALENGHLEQSLSELSRLKEQLRFQAYHDPLTGLPNRSLFVERVEERLAMGLRESMPVVLFLDLDDFKIVNDTLGHAAGDKLLVEVADRLRRDLRSDDVAARLGGDEFAVLLDDSPDLEVAMAVAERIVDSLRIAFLISDTEVEIGGSIGIAAARVGREKADELLRNADVAMYQAKSSGKRRVAIFEPTMHAEIVARQALSAELARSLGKGELVLLYQPILDLRKGQATGVEALVRWRHPTRGLMGPDEFIPLAEETGVIVALGSWVLDEACRQVAEWSEAVSTGAPITMTVNLSAQQLQEPTFVEDLRERIVRTGLDPRQLVLEMTETVMFHDTSTTIARLEAIRELGVRVAIDDFGTGYSSLGYLRRFPVDILKIAKEFIGQTDSPEEWPFAAAIIALGRALGLTIIAEGIEEPGQLAHLRGLGCELGQGYFFSVPLDADAAGRFLAEHLARPGVTARPAASDISTSRKTRSTLLVGRAKP